MRQAYQRVAPLLDDIQRYVRETLEPYARSQGYIFLDRTKDLASLSEKIEGGRYSKWSELDDLYACTIVVPVASHEAAVVRKLDASFALQTLKSREGSRKAPDVFRFDGVRWYGRLRSTASMERQPGVGDVLFEVQVITAFEYAWVAVTHDLVYKADSADWRRQRLAAQLKAAVEQIEVLIAVFDSASDVVRVSPWPESDAKTTIIDRFRLLLDDGLIPETLRPISWRRFSENVVGLIRSFETNPYKLQTQVDELISVIEADLRGAPPRELPVSGTLFQYVVSVIARPETNGNLNAFIVLESRELSDFYGVRAIPKPFKFDGVAVVPVEPSEAPGGESQVTSSEAGPDVQ